MMRKVCVWFFKLKPQEAPFQMSFASCWEAMFIYLERLYVNNGYWNKWTYGVSKNRDRCISFYLHFIHTVAILLTGVKSVWYLFEEVLDLVLLSNYPQERKYQKYLKAVELSWNLLSHFLHLQLPFGNFPINAPHATSIHPCIGSVLVIWHCLLKSVE